MTDRSCLVHLRNGTGLTIDSVTVKHNCGGDSYLVDKTIKGMAPNDEQYVFDAKYKTGAIHSDSDHWYLEYTQGDTTHKTSDGFTCELQSDDDGGTVVMSFTETNLNVKPPKSSACDKTIK